jgi:hypothetical protein
MTGRPTLLYLMSLLHASEYSKPSETVVFGMSVLGR